MSKTFTEAEFIRIVDRAFLQGEVMATRTLVILIEDEARQAFEASDDQKAMGLRDLAAFIRSSYLARWEKELGRAPVETGQLVTTSSLSDDDKLAGVTV